MTETPLVDAHVHVFTRDMPLIDNPRHAPTYDFTVEQLIATMDAHGVPFAVIAAASPWGDYNDYTIAALRAHPRLRGTVILKPTVERYILDCAAWLQPIADAWRRGRMQTENLVGLVLCIACSSSTRSLFSPDRRSAR